MIFNLLHFSPEVGSHAFVPTILQMYTLLLGLGAVLFSSPETTLQVVVSVINEFYFKADV